MKKQIYLLILLSLAAVFIIGYAVYLCVKLLQLIGDQEDEPEIEEEEEEEQTEVKPIINLNSNGEITQTEEMAKRSEG